MDTLLYDWSLPAISSLQTKFIDQAQFMQLMSVVFDPKYAFLIFSPIAYLFDQRVGKRLILAIVLAEWLNQILKWLLHGERPYWYVHSSGHFDPQQVPIKQFPITCELGPGHPSGHAMVTAAVWYIILDSLLQAYNVTATTTTTTTTASIAGQQVSNNQKLQTNGLKSNNGDNNCKQHLASTTALVTTIPSKNNLRAKLSVWSIYAALLITVSVSRIFLGCHFPHQCLAGALLGLVVAKMVCNHESKASHFIWASALLFVTAFGTFGLLQAIGLDPAWTIKLATKHCEKREYIHLDTAPFFSIMRYCGFALGTGIALLFPLKHYTKQIMTPPSATKTTTISTLTTSNGTTTNAKISSEKMESSQNISLFSIKILMALIMARLVDNLGLFVGHANLPVFYSAAFLAYTLFSFAFINL